MKQGREPITLRQEPVSEKQQARQVGGRVALNGCWELILKLIIAFIIIVWFLYNLLGQRETNPLAWIVLLLLVVLLIGLILRQRHFVFLNCNLTQPSGCKHGNTTLLAGHVLEPIVGTASGIGFSRYELEVLWNGTLSVPNAVIYADLAGNPDTSLTVGNHQVNNGNLGFVDIQQAVLGAGANILISTDFEVRLHVIGIDGSRQNCSVSFQITAARAYIKYIGGGYAPDVTNAAEQLHTADSGASSLVSVGGSISVRGAADAYGCGSEQISEYSLWVKGDSTFSLAQPANGTAYDPGSDGWSNITTVDYTTNDQRNYNKLDGMPAPDFLTNQSVWSSRTVCSYIDFLPPVCFAVPDLVEFYWGSGTSGKYSFLLKVLDTAGNTYYDIQRAWIDNELIRGRVTNLRYHGTMNDIPPCTDILVNDGSNHARQLDIRGFATDPLIVTTDPSQPTSDNFSNYTVNFRKQGAVAEVAVVASANPVPNRATWTGGVGDPPTDLLALLDLNWIDAGTPAPNDANGNPVPADNRLARGTSCTYDIFLRVYDKTIVSEVTDHNLLYTFPVKIVNDLS